MKPQRGFLFVEILFSMGLLSVLVLLILPLLNQRPTLIHRIERHHLALQIARSELEEIQAYGGTGSRGYLSAKNQAMLRLLPQGRGQVNSEPFEKGLRKVRVSVTWGEKPFHTLSLATLTR